MSKFISLTPNSDHEDPTLVAGIDRVRIILRDGNAIYSNGRNAIQVDVIYMMTDHHGKIISPEKTAFRPHIQLIDYKSGKKLNPAWHQHSSDPGYVVPVRLQSFNTQYNIHDELYNTNVCCSTCYLTHDFWLSGQKSICLGCCFTLPDGKEVMFSSVDKLLGEPVWIYTIPPQGFSAEQCKMYTETICENKKHPHYNTYNSLYLHTWYAPSGYQLKFQTNRYYPNYYQTGYEGGKQNTWWLCSGGFFTPGKNFYDDFNKEAGPYCGAEPLALNFDVSDNTFKVTTYLGTGYSWVNGSTYPQQTSGMDFCIYDQFGTCYLMHLSSCNLYQHTPVLSCQVIDN
ncbi:hypothetical protein G908_04390 [Escherichia coli UMEA 3108-1]|uniref:hypothetical protein n=1 Tax=Escherichia coli TaxID=562 RepID=UPI000390FAAF|nr:hypothetical protein [Escherichia coli]EQW60414.1 hypothetical protein G908_04390 [Escherichia coli UMEA 3108-1]